MAPSPTGALHWLVVDRLTTSDSIVSQSECLTTSATELPEQTDNASNNDADNYTEPTVGFCRNFRLEVDFEDGIVGIIFQLICGRIDL